MSTENNIKVLEVDNQPTTRRLGYGKKGVRINKQEQLNKAIAKMEASEKQSDKFVINSYKKAKILIETLEKKILTN